MARSNQVRNNNARNQEKPRRLKLESLEDRRLMATVPEVTLDANGWLQIKPASERLQTETRLSPYGDIWVQMWNRGKTPAPGKADKIYYFDSSTVKRLNFVGTEKEDLFYNTTNKDVTADGKGGNDTLWTLTSYGNSVLIGGAGDDKLTGSMGDDKLYGGNGNDVLDGAEGDDLLEGGANDDRYVVSVNDGTKKIVETTGVDTLDFRTLNLPKVSGQDPAGVKVDLEKTDVQSLTDKNGVKVQLTKEEAIDIILGSKYSDVLKGNRFNNILHGLEGDDTLYGRAGIDVLDGGKGDDGMYGGTEADTLTGGEGDDRFLIASSDDKPTDFDKRTDATINFRSGGRSWLVREIEAIDEGLAKLHTATKNTRLLKQSNGDPITFVRKTAAVAGSLAAETLADNDGGTISVYNLAFNGNRTVASIVAHEIAHNWDDAAYGAPANAQLWNEFRRISGWQNTPSPTHTKANNFDAADPWYYRTSTTAKPNTFAEEYGKNNPYEDIATAFDAYFNNPVAAAKIPQKIAVIYQFVAAMSKG